MLTTNNTLYYFGTKMYIQVVTRAIWLSMKANNLP